MTPRRGRDGERGFTLVETMVTLSLAALVAQPQVGLRRSAAANEQRQATTAAAIVDDAVALSWITNDIRAATGIATQPAATEAGSVLVLRTIESGRTVLVSWTLEADRLLRVVTDGSGRPLSTATVLEPVRRLPTPAFTLRDRFSRPLDATAGSAIDLTACTSTIEIHLDHEVNRIVPVAESTVALRATRGGTITC